MFLPVALLVGLTLAQTPLVIDLDGNRVDPLRADGAVAATVLVFLRTDCPIANQAAPEIERARREFGERGVRFWLVYLDPHEPVSRIRKHLEEYALQAPALRDPEHSLVQLTGVTRTPEAALFVHGKGTARLVYRGRLDDRYLDFGRRRPRPTRYDLREAIAAALDGRLRTLRTTPAVGCEIADLR